MIGQPSGITTVGVGIVTVDAPDAGRVGVGVRVAAPAWKAVSVAVWVGVAFGVSVGTMGVSVGIEVGVSVASGIGVSVGASVGAGVKVAVKVMVGIGVSARATAKGVGGAAVPGAAQAARSRMAARSQSFEKRVGDFKSESFLK